MKVSLAAQTLSQSVADAIKFCRDTLGLPQFQGSEATEEFIRCLFNFFFNVLIISVITVKDRDAAATKQ